jgi:hypothetical protein
LADQTERSAIELFGQLRQIRSSVRRQFFHEERLYLTIV